MDVPVEESVKVTSSAAVPGSGVPVNAATGAAGGGALTDI